MTGVKNINGKRFRRMVMGAADVKAAMHVQASHRINSFAEAVRTCLHQQQMRDRCLGAPHRRAEPAAAAELARRVFGAIPDAAEYQKKAHPLVTKVERAGVTHASVVSPPEKEKHLIWRFWPDDEAALEAVMKAWGFHAVSDAVRFAVRVQAMLDGFAPPPGKWTAPDSSTAPAGADKER